MANAIVHWEIGAMHERQLLEFYQQMFDWNIDTTNPEYAMVAAADGGIGGGIMQMHGGVPPYVTIYVSVDDLAASLAKAEGLGGKTIVPPTPIPNVGAFAMFQDPEGHVIGLLKSEGPQ